MRFGVNFYRLTGNSSKIVFQVESRQPEIEESCSDVFDKEV